MSVRSVIDVEVNDGAFKRFHELFKQYQEALKGTGTAWASVEGSTKSSAQNFEMLTAAVMAQNEVLKESAETGDSFAASAERSAYSWRDISSSAQKVVRFVDKISLGVLKWSTLGGLLGMGGLWGLVRMAMGVAGARSTARGLGANYGGVSAFATDFGRFVNPADFMQHISGSLADPSKRASLGALGMSAADLKGDTDEVAVRALERARDLAKRTPAGLEESMIQAYHLDQSMGMTAEQFRGLARTPDEEFNEQVKAFRGDKGKFNLSSEDQSAWQKFMTTLERAGKTVETAFIQGLTRLTGPLGKLSDAIVQAVQTLMKEGGPFDKGVAALTSGVTWLAEELGKPEFQKSVEQFVSDFEKVAAALARGLHKLAGWLGKDSSEEPSKGYSGSFGKDKMGLTKDVVEAWQAGRQKDQAAAFSDLKRLYPDAADELTNAHPELLKAKPSVAAPNFDVASLEHAQMMAESAGNPNATSPKGAMGLYQFMPKTWEQYKPWPSASPYDPVANRFARDRYMHDLESHYQGDMTKALAAYNWGPGNLDKDIAKNGPAWREHLPAETSNYLDKVFSKVPGGGTQVTVNNNTGGSTHVAVNQVAM